MDCSVLVVRHAKPVGAGLCYGQSEIEVELPPGTAAERIIHDFPELPLLIDIIWTSPLQRARHLAEALGDLCGRAIRVDSRLSELDFGEWEGRQWEDIYRSDRERFARWAAAPMQLAPPGGETGLVLTRRILAWACDIGRTRGLAVTHAGPIRALRALAASNAAVENLSLDFERSVPHLSVERVNLVSHS